MIRLLPFVFILLVTGGVIVFVAKPKTLPSPGQALPTISQSLPSGPAPKSFKIENVPFNYGANDCCYCAGMMAMMKYRGITENQVQDYWKQLEGKNYYQDNAVFYRLLKRYGIEGKFRLAYFPHGTKEIAFKDVFSTNLSDYQKQITLLKTQEEALPTLKVLISQGSPVMVMVEDRKEITSDEIQDDTFILVYGYDEKKIYFWTLPSVQNSWSTEEFLERWKLQENSFPFSVFPGRYTMIWLEK